MTQRASSWLIRGLLACSAAVLAACGGGVDVGVGVDVGPRGPTYLSWSGSVNGSVVLDAYAQSFGVETSTGQVYARSTTTPLGQFYANSQGDLFFANQYVGTVSLVTSTNGNPITVLQCLNGQYMKVSVGGGTWNYDCTSGGTSPSLPAANGGFVTWAGSINGSTVVDGNGAGFGVRQSDRRVIDLVNNRVLTGLTVDSSARMWLNNQQIGTVTMGPSTQGQSIAIMTCTNNRYMTISSGAGNWNYSCN